MNAPLGILVRGDPYSRRAGRERLDPALAAASLDMPLRVFFIGDGLLHLLPGQQSERLPAVQFTKGWGALDGLSEHVELYVESAAFERVCGAAGELKTRVQVLEKTAIAGKMSECRAVLHV